MNEAHAILGKNPERRANFVSRIFFWHIVPFMCRGWSTTQLFVEDLFHCLPQDESQLLHAQLSAAWQSELDNKSTREPSLQRAIIGTYGRQFMWYGLVLLLEEVTKLVQPVAIGGLVRYFRFDAPITEQSAYVYAAVITLCAGLFPVFHHPYFYACQKVGMRIKMATSALIYTKSLKLSCGALQKSSKGHIVNLMSTDVVKYDMAVIFAHYMWVAPLMLIPYTVLLWRELGVSCLAGFACMIALVPLQGYFSRRMGGCRAEVAVAADKRINVMSEILNGMRIIKMYAWEGAFSEIISKRRGDELGVLKKFVSFQSLVLGTFWASGRMVILCTVAAFLAGGNELTAEKVFVSAILFNMSRLPLTLFLPLSLTMMFEAKVSTQRIQAFLLLDEHEPLKVKSKEGMNGLSKEYEMKSISPVTHGSVAMKNLTAKWDDEETLKDISLNVESGELLAIIGRVGAGKSSILSALLGDMHIAEGTVKAEGRIAYVPQTAWLFNGSIKENIIFGNVYDPQMFDTALSVTGLSKDIMAMPNGAETLIGDRGMTLSGGQKARINLARAVYQDNDIYLLDDPLSAVDSQVGRHIFNKCILEHLKTKTVILVTHQIHYLDDLTDGVMLLCDGRCAAVGTLDKLKNSHPLEFEELEAETVTGRSRTESLPGQRQSHDAAHEGDDEHGPLLKKQLSRPHAMSTGSLVATVASEKLLPADDDTEEDITLGSVKFSVYWAYIKEIAPNYINMIALFMFVVIVQAVMNVSDWLINIWTTAAEHRFELSQNSTSNLTLVDEFVSQNETIWSNEIDDTTYLRLYALLCVVLMILGVVRVLVFRFALLRSSRILHARMFQHIIHTTMAFFDNNPVGRILNRFSKDINAMDEQLAFVFYDFIQGALGFMSIFLVVGLLQPLVFIPTVPIGILFMAIRTFYVRTSRQVKRLEAQTRSPILTHVSSTLSGLSTIRAYSAESAVLADYHAYANVHTAAFSTTLVTGRWFAGTIDWLVVVYIGCVTFLSVYLGRANFTTGGIGLVLFYSMDMTRYVARFYEMWTRFELHMVSVERIFNYCELESEESKTTQVQSVPKDWPSRGYIQMKGVSVNYGKETVLKNINVEIPAGHKIGIVGRTGAGKSTLLSAIFRLVEPRGEILIDDVNIQRVPLSTLRPRLSIIPQDPVLFIGSLRENLDPFVEFTDDVIWVALEQVRGLADQLSHHMHSDTLSVGQRQLVCLARALLRHNKIIVIDEATANVDTQTDALIQTTLRTSFADCTVLTIAHRLNTIIDANKVIVLSDGQLIEYDSPVVLLKKKTSLLASLAQESGDYDKLVAVAKKADKSRRDNEN